MRYLVKLTANCESPAEHVTTRAYRVRGLQIFGTFKPKQPNEKAVFNNTFVDINLMLYNLPSRRCSINNQRVEPTICVSSMDGKTTNQRRVLYGVSARTEKWGARLHIV